jgi:hypothetical protein
MFDAKSNLLSTLVNGFTFYGRKMDARGLKVMLVTAYFDESGLGEAEKVCVVAGFMGNDAQWASLAHDWLEAIKPRKYLHVKDLRFTGTKAHRARSVLAKCGPIPYRYNLEPIVGAVRHDDAKATFAARGLNDVFSTPFMLAMNAAIHVALRLLDPDDSLSIVYEYQERYKKAMSFQFEQVFKLRQIDHRVQGIVPVTKGQTCCTEPADYLAYMTREGVALGETEIFKMGQSIFGGNTDINGHQWSRQQLDDMVTEYISKGIIIPSDFMRN